MRTLTIDVTDLGGEARPGDRVVLWRPRVSGSATHAGRVISTAPHTVLLEDGKATVPDVEPGDMSVLLQCRGVESQGPIDVVVPDGTGTVTLRSLLETQFEYSPPVVSAVQQAADNAAASERAAIQAQVRSEAAADRAETRVDEAINNGANLIRAEVKQDADRAVAAKNDAQAAQVAAELARDAAGVSEANAAQSENDAAQSASAAAMSASQAAENATSTAQDADRAETARAEAVQAQAGAAQSEANAAASAQAAATSASNAATSEANAQDSATAAAGSASEASAHADRAEQAADPTGLRNEVMQQIANLVDGAPEDLDTIREVAEYAQANRDITDALNAAIGNKANKAHTHTTSQVEGLDSALAGKAETTHTHALADVTGLQSALDGKANTATVNQRPALFSGAGAPPASIPGAVVGDWWLDTDSKNLYTITGV